MSDVLFAFDVAAAPETVRRALTTTEGIASFWTADAQVPDQPGESFVLGFPDAPLPFDLLLVNADEDNVTWRAQTFPPQWAGTEIRWNISDADSGSTVSFRHGSFADDADTARFAYVWGQVMVQLKSYAETGVAAPVFARS